jgi:ferredoxin
MSFAGPSEWFIRHSMARPASVDELLRVLDLTTERGLVHLMDNVLNQPAFLCHCCGCCCVALNPSREYGKLPAQPSNFIPSLDHDACSGCGTCAESCQINVIAMSDAESGSPVPVVNKERCLGCGVCSSSCPTGALTMSRRPDVYAPPVDKMELLARIARERGKN